MWPALQGGIAFETGRATSHPESKHVVAMISDGFTADFSLCPIYGPAEVIATAKTGREQTPSIDTYVLALKSLTDPLTARFAGLDQVAAAGGTQASIGVDSSDVSRGTNEALQSVRRRARPCDFILPGTADPAMVSLALLPATAGDTGELPRVASDASCGNEGGWYFDDPALPSRMLLCPHTCTLLRQDDNHHVTALQGCEAATR
jgi:hypothetical protein